MNRRLLGVAAAAVVVVGAGAFVSLGGLGPAGTGETPADGSGDGAAGGGGGDGAGDGASDGDSGSPDTTPLVTVSGDGGATSEEPFVFTVEEIEQCGNTCRNVTTSLANQQSTDASGVNVTTDIYAGNGTDGDPVWSGDEAVGELPAGDTYTVTRRVELGFSDGLAIEQNDGWITIETTIRSDSTTMTVVQHRDVS